MAAAQDEDIRRHWANYVLGYAGADFKETEPFGLWLSQVYLPWTGFTDGDGI